MSAKRFQMPKSLSCLVVFLSTFSVDKKSPAELEHITDVTGQSPANKNTTLTL